MLQNFSSILSYLLLLMAMKKKKKTSPTTHKYLSFLGKLSHFCFFRIFPINYNFPLPTFLQEVASKSGGTFVALREGHLNALFITCPLWHPLRCTSTSLPKPVTCHRLCRHQLSGLFPTLCSFGTYISGPDLKATSILPALSQPPLWNLCILSFSSPLTILIPCQAAWTHLCKTCCLPVLPRESPLLDLTSLTGGCKGGCSYPLKGSSDPGGCGQRAGKALSQETYSSVWFCFTDMSSLRLLDPNPPGLLALWHHPVVV